MELLSTIIILVLLLVFLKKGRSLVLKILLYPLYPLLFFMQWLAEEGILFTTVKEGTAKAIMRGDSFDHFIMSFAGYHLNDPRKGSVKEKDRYRERRESDPESKGFPDWEVLYHGVGNQKGFTNEDDDYYDDRPWILKQLGLYWVGWPWANSVYVYQFEWNETYTDSTLGEEKLLPRAEATDFIYVADFIYAIKTIGAETLDRLPTDELTLITIAVRNPYRALFSGEDWMRRITATIIRHVRTFVGNRKYQQLISPKEKDSANEESTQQYWAQFSKPIIDLNTKLPDDEKERKPAGLKGRYGIEIRTADLQSMDLSADGKIENQAAATKNYIAQQAADAQRLAFQAEADGIEMKGKTEAEALRERLRVIKEFGEAGVALAGFDAIQESSKNPGSTIIWANNPIPSFANLLKPEKKGEEKP